MIIETERLRLRPLYEHEIADFAKLANDYSVAQMFSLKFPYPFTVDDAKYHQVKLQQRHKTAQPHSFIIALRTTDHIIGGGGLDGGSDVSDLPALGYWIASAQRGHGYAQEAVSAFINLGFYSYNYSAIAVDIATNNDPSLKLARALGFKARQVYHVPEPDTRNGWRTYQHFTITQQEWEKLQHA